MLVITGIEVINHTKSTRHLPGCCGSLTPGTIGRMRKRPLGPVELKSPACEGRELAAVLAGHSPLDALDDGRDRTSIVLELSVSCDSPDPSRVTYQRGVVLLICCWTVALTRWTVTLTGRRPFGSR